MTTSARPLGDQPAEALKPAAARSDRRPPHEADGAHDAEAWRADDVLAAVRMPDGTLPPLVADAAPLLSLAHEITRLEQRPDVAALRETLLAALTQYEHALGRAGIAPEHASAAHYIVCATLDDVVAATVWGQRAGWSRSGLVATFHADVADRERVFDLLAHFRRDPERHPDVLLLLHLALSLGFEGRTRGVPRGTLTVAETREDLARILRGRFGPVGADLSPHWRGVAAPHRASRLPRWLWALPVLVVLPIALGALGTAHLMSRMADATLGDLASLARDGTPSLLPLKPQGPVAEAAGDPLGALVGALQRDAAAGRLVLTRERNTVLLRIPSAALFAEGSAAIAPRFAGTLRRIAAALAAQRLTARVTDRTADARLGEARTRTVAALLKGTASRAIGPGSEPDAAGGAATWTEVLVRAAPQSEPAR